MNCPACYESVPEDRARPCPHCGAIYHVPCIENAPCVVAGCQPARKDAAPEALVPSPRSKAWQVRAVELTLVVLSIGILAAIAIPNYKAARMRDAPRPCYANQKTIVGAMEMYDLDKNTKRTVLDAAFFVALKSGGYLQSIPQDPGQGPGTSANYRATETGNGITCTFHGPIALPSDYR